jgi:alpha,alpha-trehalase
VSEFPTRAGERRDCSWRARRLTITLMKTRLLCASLLLAGVQIAQARGIPPPPPSALYAGLFERVQSERLFPDSKTFVDSTPRSAPAEILRRYHAQRSQPDFSLREFVAENFVVPAQTGTEFRTAAREELRVHVNRLWSVLAREPREPAAGDSHLALTARYVVPGGRFREMYYWDSYFTMLGLQVDGRDDLVASMVGNFAGLIDRYGHIPNGTRSYYLGRSQPPFFAAMVLLEAERDGTRALVQRLPQLEREHDFWMAGAVSLAPGGAYRRVVRLRDGALLNRYWDDFAIPRDEAWSEDVATARAASRPPAEVYRDLRAAAESGWDFSSRWLADGKTLATIHTTDFLPVDLNALLYQLELTIARGCGAAARADCVDDMTRRARARRQAMQSLMWDETLGTFVDYDWRQGRRSTRVTAAASFPLFVGAATRQQARKLAGTLRTQLLMPHGLATTTEETGQQWDQPNGWAPLQWIAVAGLRRYGEADLARDIAGAWVRENARVYCRSGKLVEKYDIREAGEGAGGEYPVQDGFGWTNGVLVKLLALYPALARPRYEYTGGDCP